MRLVLKLNSELINILLLQYYNFCASLYETLGIKIFNLFNRQEEEVEKIKKIAEEAKNVSSKAFALADSALKQQQNTR